MDLAAVAVFVHVAETASFRGAAESLGIPRSTVSRRVAYLEKQLGTRLLKRTTRAVSLTDAGAAYLRACQPALGALEEAAREISTTAVEARGRLRVTAPINFGDRFMGPMIEHYLRENPHVELDVLLTDRHVDVVQEGVDLAFRAGGVRDESLVAREIGRAQLRCYASPRYLHDRKKPRVPADLADHDCVVYPPLAVHGRWTFSAKQRTVHQSVRGRLVVNSMVLSVDAAVRGLGIARLPAPMAMEEVERGTLVEVLPSFAPPAGAVYLVYAGGAHVPPRVRTFIDVALRYLPL